MKATIEFDLNSERREYERAINAEPIYEANIDILRSLIDYYIKLKEANEAELEVYCSIDSFFTKIKKITADLRATTGHGTEISTLLNRMED